MEVVADASLGGSGPSEVAPMVAGRDRVLSEVYRDKVGVLRGLAVAMTRDQGVADELVQEAFIRTLRARGAPSQPDQLFFYLVRVVSNLTRTHAAKAARRAARRADVERGAGAGADADHHAPGALVEAVAGLPRRQREVVFLRFWLDLSVEETARTMGISAGAVKTHSSRALDRLRAVVDEPGGSE
jgi:RNA polymerase sigma factor (sigma-70 family)